MSQSSTGNETGKSSSIFANVNWKNFVAGTAGGAAATALFHPLELIKIRWQVYEAASLLNTGKAEGSSSPVYRPKYKSLLDTAKTVYRTENGIRGLYRGIAINTLASGTAWGAYFLIYNSLKDRDRRQVQSESNDSTKDISVYSYTLNATIAGVTTITITNPLFLIKTRMCLQYSVPAGVSSSNQPVKYTSSWHAFRSLVQRDGFRGLYKGIVPGYFGTMNGTIQMVSYDLMKSWWLRRLNRQAALRNDQSGEQSLDSFHYTLFSGLSKILAVTCTYPFQLVRARLQDQHREYKNLMDVISKTFKNESIYGFYKGLIPCLLRVTPAASLTFIVYENLLIFLNRSSHQPQSSQSSSSKKQS